MKTIMILAAFAATAPGNTLDLAGNPGATPLVAFSLRHLSSAYTGSAIQVRRSSDNDTMSIGFTGAGDLDTAALKAFVGSDSGYVSTWYDQSGKGYNATQTTPAYQPAIVCNGVINRDNGLPSVYTSGTGFLSYGPIGQLGGATQVTRMEVCRSRDTNNLIISEGLGVYQLDLQLFPAQIWVQFEDNNVVAASAVNNTVNLMSVNSVRSSGASSMYVNTALLGSTASAVFPFTAPVIGYIGVRFDNSISPVGPGAFSETILFDSVLPDADRQSINYNENWYYSLGFDPCSSTQAGLTPDGQTTEALYACTQDGPWAYYYDPAHPLNVVFGIAGASPSFSADSIDLTVAPDPAAAGYSATSGQNGIFALGRYWNVYTHTPLTSPVNVRFFYNPADTLAALNEATNFKNATGASLISNLQWFKTVGGPFSPDSLTATPQPGIKGQILGLTPVYGSKDGINYAEFDGIPSFSGGTGVYIVSNTPITLPIVINPFTCTAGINEVLLNWTVTSEINSIGFGVERSNDGRNWTAIGSTTAYSFTDVNPVGYPGCNYYRLKVIYKSGQYFYTNVIAATLPSPHVFTLTPNPFAGDLTITGTIPDNGPVELQLVDMTGATLVRQQYAARKGVNVFHLVKLGNLPAGVYVVMVRQGGVVGIAEALKFH